VQGHEFKLQYTRKKEKKEEREGGKAREKERDIN
jgi:hypothetical protein